MNYEVTPLKKGIVRISAHKIMPKNYLERYGIISIPEKDNTADAVVCENKITLPDGRVLEFKIRPETDDDFWGDEIRYQIDKFQDKIPTRINIEGRPEDTLMQWNESLNGMDSKKKFGISFKIDDNEQFYGLGEAGREDIKLRGDSYQNWTVYQFDEIIIPLVMSDQNWGLFICVQDRHFVDIDDFAKGRLTVIGNFDELDIFVLYGNSMKEMLRLYTDISGKSMLLPKWGYGLTYDAPFHADQFQVLDQMMKFREKHIPCDNVSLEPGWMQKQYDYSFDKDWCLEKFHIEQWMRKRDVQYSFLSVLRRYGFHTTLWLCLNYDFCDHEERLAGGEGKLQSWYDHLEKFVTAGADGFKLDPADMVMRIDPNKIYTNGKSELEMHNISQVIIAKQIYNGFAQQMNMRPFVHYCGGYIGQQKWCAGTTGDNGGLFGAMIWLQNLAMSGFMNSTVDMDVYNPAAIHFAMLAPWAQHNAWSGCRQAWYAGDENEKIYTEYARLRYGLIPYIYSAAIECHETSVPMIRPMPLEFQSDKKASNYVNQYMLGEWILLSAFTNEIYLPEGEWVDYWTGEEYKGPYVIENYSIPEGKGGGFFIKKGAIIPKWRDRDYVGQYSDEEIQLHFYPCGKTEYIFREDDGESLDYTENVSCHTYIECDDTSDKVKIKIGKRVGDYKNKSEKRTWMVYVHGCDKEVEVFCDEENAEIKIM